MADCELDGFYHDYHQGIQFLFETTLVYLIFRELLATDFVRKQQCEVRWEESYDDNIAKKADLVLKHRSLPSAYIECKIWRHEYAEDLKADIRKMTVLPPESRRFLLVLWVDQRTPEANVEWLERNLGVSAVRHCCFQTRTRNRFKEIETRNLVLALLEVARGAR